MTTIAYEPTDVILRDGSTLRLRPPVAADTEMLLAFFEQLSDQSRYLRFHGFPALGPKLVEPFVDPDWEETGALVGCLEGRVVALANYARLRDRRAAEVAFTVGDDYQRRGIGTRLLERLVALAAEHGIEQFVAEVLPENRNMLDVFRDAGFNAVRELDGGEVEVRFPIAPTAHYRDVVAARDHVAVRASLRPFFEPAHGRRARRLVAPRLDRRRALPQHPRRRLPRRRLSGEPEGRAGRRRPRLLERRRHPRRGRAGRALPPRRARDPGLRRGARGRRPRARRHLRRLRRDRPGGRRAPGPAARARPLPRRAADRPELPGHRVRRGRPERDVRAARLPEREDRLLVAERRPRARAARARPRRAGSGSPRSSRSETRPTCPRTTCSNGGRTTTRPSS